MQASWNTLCHLVVGSSFECHSLWFGAFCRELLGVMCSSWNFTECVVGHNNFMLEPLLLEVHGKNTSWSCISQNVIMVLWFSTVCSHIAAKCIDSIAITTFYTDAKSYIVSSNEVVYQVYQVYYL